MSRICPDGHLYRPITESICRSTGFFLWNYSDGHWMGPLGLTYSENCRTCSGAGPRLRGPFGLPSDSVELCNSVQLYRNAVITALDKRHYGHCFRRGCPNLRQMSAKCVELWLPLENIRLPWDGGC
eukprot:scaffold1410_cov386-Prasinococcus_capsulatus_cf.AAC.19